MPRFSLQCQHVFVLLRIFLLSSDMTQNKTNFHDVKFPNSIVAMCLYTEPIRVRAPMSRIGLCCILTQFSLTRKLSSLKYDPLFSHTLGELVSHRPPSRTLFVNQNFACQACQWKWKMTLITRYRRFQSIPVAITGERRVVDGEGKWGKAEKSMMKI